MSDTSQEAATTTQAYFVRWRGGDLSAEHGMLVGGKNNRVGLDGHVHWLQGSRVGVTTAQRFGTGHYDGWVLDTRSGFRVAWRGFDELEVSSTRLTALLMLDSYSVLFSRDAQRSGPPIFDSIQRRETPFRPTDWLATLGPLERGEVILDARQPKSLVRSVRRARQAGAVPAGDSGLLVFTSRVPREQKPEWPPAPRVRKPRAPSGEGKNHPRNKRW